MEPEPRLGKLRGRHIPEGAVRPDVAVVEAPGLDLAPSMPPGAKARALSCNL